MKSGTSGVPPQRLRRTRFSIVIPALSALAALTLLAGCGGGGGGSSSGTSTTGGTTTGGTTTGGTTTGGPTGAAASVSAPALSNFTAVLSEDKSGISTGGSVTYTLSLMNTSSSAATIVTTTSGATNIPIASLSVTNGAGTTVYPPGVQPGLKPKDSPPPPPGGGPLTLQPGQSVSLTRTLSVFSTAGTYQAVASFSVAATSSDTLQTVTLSPLAVTVN